MVARRRIEMDETLWHGLKQAGRQRTLVRLEGLEPRKKDVARAGSYFSDTSNVNGLGCRRASRGQVKDKTLAEAAI